MHPNPLVPHLSVLVTNNTENGHEDEVKHVSFVGAEVCFHCHFLFCTEILGRLFFTILKIYILYFLVFLLTVNLMFFDTLRFVTLCFSTMASKLT